MGLVSAMGLHVSSQSLLVLELDPALWTRVGLGVVSIMKLLVDCQVILPRECFRTMTAGELVIFLMSSLVSPQAVTPLECLTTLVAGVSSLAGVGVHVRGEVLLHPGAVLTQRTTQLIGSSLALPCSLLTRNTPIILITLPLAG